MSCCCVLEALLKLHILYTHMHRGRVEELNTKDILNVCECHRVLDSDVTVFQINFMTSCTQKPWFPLKVPCRNAQMVNGQSLLADIE